MSVFTCITKTGSLQLSEIACGWSWVSSGAVSRPQAHHPVQQLSICAGAVLATSQRRRVASCNGKQVAWLSNRPQACGMKLWNGTTQPCGMNLWHEPSFNFYSGMWTNKDARGYVEEPTSRHLSTTPSYSAMLLPSFMTATYRPSKGK